ELLTMRDSAAKNVSDYVKDIIRREKDIIETEERIAKNPNETSSYYKLSVLYSYSNKIKSVAYLIKAIALNPTVPAYYMDLSFEYEIMGNKEDAMKIAAQGVHVMDSVLPLYPNEAPCKMDYAHLLYADGEHERAIRYTDS